MDAADNRLPFQAALRKVRPTHALRRLWSREK